MNAHPTEREIQQYAIDRENCGQEIINHFNKCDACRAEAEAYRMIFTSIKEQPKPVFDFDLSTTVVARLPQAKRKISSDSVVMYLFLIVSLVIPGMLFYTFRNILADLYSGFSETYMFLTAICAAGMMIFLVMDMARTYREKKKILNSV